MIISTVFFLIRFKVIKRKFCKLNMNMCNLLINYWWNIHCQIFSTKTMMHTLREETFANNIFAIYGLICKSLLHKHKMLLWKKIMNVMKKSTIFKENVQKLDTICKKFVLQNCFSVNESQKQALQKILSVIVSTAFKLSDLLTTFLIFRLLRKAYTLYGRRSGNKSFKETKICGVIVSKFIFFIWRFFLLSKKKNWVSSISF